MSEFIEWMLVLALVSLAIRGVSKSMRTERDVAWIGRFIGWGFAFKVAGSLVRYYVAADVYGYGDAFEYHIRGQAFAGVWRNLSLPVSMAGGEGTAFTELTTGLLYAIYTPTMRTGFLVFAFLAFLGQVMFYAAFRPWLPTHALRRYALALFFVPSIAFWPASVGKDALVMLFSGLATLGISRLMRRFDAAGVAYSALGLFMTAQIRPHIATMLILAAVFAIVFVKRRSTPLRGFRRLLPLALAVGGLTLAWGALTSDFGVSLGGGPDAQDPTEFLHELSSHTAQGGSEVSDGVITDLLDIPTATLKVVFRPLINEASSPVMFISAVEGTALLALIVLRLPHIWRNRRLVRRNPLLLMSLFFTGGFVIAFSAVLNLGILARQRVQVFPFLFALIAVLGWPNEENREQDAPPPGNRYPESHDRHPATQTAALTVEPGDHYFPSVGRSR